MKWKVWIGVGISMLFLGLAIMKVEFYEVKGAMANAKYIYLIPAIFLTILNLWIRSFRWRFFLEPIKKIGMSSLFSATAIGLMVNNLLPARIGEFARAYAIGEMENISKSSSFATIVVERIFDGITIMLFLSFVLILYTFSFPVWMSKLAYIACAIFLVSLGILILVKVKTSWAMNLASFILRPFPKKLEQNLLKYLGLFIDGLIFLQNSKYIFASGVLSLFVWIPVALVIYFLLISFEIYLPIYVSFLLLIFLVFGAMIPSAPGYVGTVQFICVTGLSLFAVPKNQALGFSIVYHATQFLPMTIIGFYCLLRKQLSFSKITKNLDEW